MNHIFLVVELERSFGVKFQAAEMEELKNVGELVHLIAASRPRPPDRGLNPVSGKGSPGLLFNSYAFLFAFLPLTLIGFYVAARLGHRAGGGVARARLARFLRLVEPGLRPAAARLHRLQLQDRPPARAAAGRPRLQTGLLGLGIAGNIGLLVWFKYLVALLGVLRAQGVADIPFDRRDPAARHLVLHLHPDRLSRGREAGRRARTAARSATCCS